MHVVLDVLFGSLGVSAFLHPIAPNSAARLKCSIYFNSMNVTIYVTSILLWNDDFSFKLNIRIFLKNLSTLFRQSPKNKNFIRTKNPKILPLTSFKLSLPPFSAHFRFFFDNGVWKFSTVCLFPQHDTLIQNSAQSEVSSSSHFLKNSRLTVVPFLP